MQEEQKKLKRQLTIIFWLNIVFAIFLALFLLSQIGILGRSVTEQDFIWERFSIILTIAVIPLSLKLFYKKYKEIEAKELPCFIEKLRRYYLLRIIALDILILANFLGFYLIGSMNFFYMAIITMFIFAFCYPTEALIDPVQEEVKTDNTNE